MTVIDAKMSAIYHAAHDVLPGKATEFAQQADSVSSAIEPVAAQLALAGGHPLGPDLGDLATELFLHLRAMVRTFNDSAVALDKLADDLVAVDDAAAEWFRTHQRFAGDPPLATEPTPPEL